MYRITLLVHDDSFRNSTSFQNTGFLARLIIISKFIVENYSKQDELVIHYPNFTWLKKLIERLHHDAYIPKQVRFQCQSDLDILLCENHGSVPLRRLVTFLSYNNILALDESKFDSLSLLEQFAERYDINCNFIKVDSQCLKQGFALLKQPAVATFRILQGGQEKC